MTTGETPPNEQSTGQLVAQLSEQTTRLVRDELELAKLELKASVRHAGLGAGLLSAAGLLSLYGLGALIATGVIALALALPLWAAALIVTGVLFAAAAIAALIGKGQVGRASPKPGQTIENVHKDITELKEGHHGDE